MRGKVLRKWHRKVENRQARKLEPRDTAIVDSGASWFYGITVAPVSDIDPSAPRVFAARTIVTPTTGFAMRLGVLWSVVVGRWFGRGLLVGGLW